MSNFKVQRYEIPAPIPYNTSKTFVGFDTGTAHAGIAILKPNAVHIYQVSIERSKDPMERIKTIQTIWRSLQIALPYELTVIIEGAAFMSSTYRQAELAECRTSFAIELAKHEGVTVKWIAPNSIRKTVFGHAKIKAHEHWTTLYDVNNFAPIKDCPDALAALSCAYYGVMTDV